MHTGQDQATVTCAIMSCSCFCSKCSYAWPWPCSDCLPALAQMIDGPNVSISAGSSSMEQWGQGELGPGHFVPANVVCSFTVGTCQCEDGLLLAD